MTAVSVAGKTNPEAKLPEPIKDLNANYVEAHRLIQEKLPEVLKDYKWEIRWHESNWGKEMLVYTNALPSILYDMAKDIGVPKPYGEWSLGWAFSEKTDEEKLAEGLYPRWLGWGVRLDYVKATNGFNTAENWLESRGCEECVPHVKKDGTVSERIKFCENHKLRKEDLE